MYMMMGGKKTVLTLAPGWRICRTRPDSMHCVNLGIGHLAIGNVLWFLAIVRAYLVLGPAVDHVLPPDAAMQDVLQDL